MEDWLEKRGCETRRVGWKQWRSWAEHDDKANHIGNRDRLDAIHQINDIIIGRHLVEWMGPITGLEIRKMYGNLLKI